MTTIGFVDAIAKLAKVDLFERDPKTKAVKTGRVACPRARFSWRTTKTKRTWPKRSFFARSDRQPYLPIAMLSVRWWSTTRTI